jgi:hypothetical protein
MTQPITDWLFKSELCTKMAGKCAHGGGCTFAHGLKELKVIPLRALNEFFCKTARNGKFDAWDGEILKRESIPSVDRCVNVMKIVRKHVANGRAREIPEWVPKYFFEAWVQYGDSFLTQLTTPPQPNPDSAAAQLTAAAAVRRGRSRSKCERARHSRSHSRRHDRSRHSGGHHQGSRQHEAGRQHEGGHHQGRRQREGGRGDSSRQTSRRDNRAGSRRDSSRQDNYAGSRHQDSRQDGGHREDIPNESGRGGRRSRSRERPKRSQGERIDISKVGK